MTIPLVHDLELATTKLEVDESDTDTLVGSDEAESPSKIVSWNPKATGDRLASVVKGALPFLSHLGLIVLIVVGHLIALALVAGWTSLWFQGIRGILGFDKDNTPSAPAPGMSGDQPSWFDSLFATVAISVWTVMASIAFLVGTVGCFAIVGSMAYFLIPYLRVVVNPLAYHISRVVKPWYAELIEPIFMARRPSSAYTPLHDQAPIDGELDNLGITEGNNLGSAGRWLEKVSTPSQAIISLFKNPGPRMQVFYDLVSYILTVTLYVVAHAAALFPPFAWSTIWSYGLIKVWQGGFTGAGETGFFIRIFVVAFLLVWSAGALGAIGIGFFGCYVALSSFVAPVLGRESRISTRIWMYRNTGSV